jgi:hypothetical protein
LHEIVLSEITVTSFCKCKSKAFNVLRKLGNNSALCFFEKLIRIFLGGQNSAKGDQPIPGKELLKRTNPICIVDTDFKVYLPGSDLRLT